MKHPVKPTVLTGFLVEKLNWTGSRVESAVLINRLTGERLLARARNFILSAGSLGSPPILLRSGLDEKFPHMRWAGKNLMRHANAIVSYVFPFKTNPQAVFHKQIAISYFYDDLRDKTGLATGVIQDIYTPERKVVSAFAPAGLKWIAGALSERIQSLLCVAEDEPQEVNRVELSTQRDRFGVLLPQIHHQYTAADIERRDYLIAKARLILKQAGGKISRLMKIDSFSHAVGTLKFGHSEKNSVLDSHCRFHGLENLYVADGSFMPSSGGVNPSLSITANSLRVADALLQSMEQAA